ncbi:MAG: acid phosphatase [Phycisphaerales bacterium]|nr:acid phosphatase [Phycisphaerales bacterium]
MSLGAATARALPPRYDHVVVVVLENSSYSQVLGATAGANAPYLNGTLAAEGTRLSGFYGVHHPSVQNYGELFAGYDTGATNTALAPNWPLTTPNLGAELRQNGFSFAGYSQSMPSIGYTGISDGSTATPYASRHNPWVNWQNNAANASPNQLPSTTNVRFSDFPAAANYAQLPTVAFVVPDNDNNMHNGATPDRIIAGDAWVKNNINAYYQWAKTHNSLLIVTTDEDDSSAGNNNNAPMLFAGPGVKAGGVVANTYTLHNVLRTLEDMYALPHAGTSASVRPIVGPFTTDPTVNRATFRQGQSGYTGAKDTYVRETQPTASFATAVTLSSDLDDNSTVAGNQRAHALLRFDNIIAGAGGTIPTDATILSAKLTLYTTNLTLNPVEVHRMISSWGDTSTWSSLSGGISADGIEAAVNSDFTFAPSLADNTMHFDVSDTLQRWVDGTQANNGWAILPTGTDGFGFDSAEGATIAQRPQLEVSYALYPRFTGAGGSWNTASNWANGTPGGSATVARFLTRATAATLTLDASKTVGTLLLDSPSAYTVNSGTGGTLTFANAGNVATLQAKQGQHTLNVPLNFADPGQLDVAAGAKVTATAGLIVSAGKPLAKLGTGVFQITGGLTMGAGATLDITAGELSADRITGNGALTVHSGATARLTAVALASTVSAVTLAGTAGAWTGKVDLGKSGLTIDYAGASPLAITIDQVKFARAANWTGAGIGSAAAATTPGAAVAISEASALLGLTTGQTASFMGQTVDNTTLLLRFTAAGDATMDGTVDFLDLAKLAQSYNTAPGIGAWAKGDFNYDGIVDFLDLAAMAQNYNTSISLAAPLPGAPADFSADLQAAFAQANAPEPTALPFLAFSLGLLRNRRNR